VSFFAYTSVSTALLEIGHMEEQPLIHQRKGTNESSYMPDFFMDYLYSLIFVGIALLPTPPIGQKFPPPPSKIYSEEHYFMLAT
jgi:hypothetical protein